MGHPTLGRPLLPLFLLGDKKEEKGRFTHRREEKRAWHPLGHGEISYGEGVAWKIYITWVGLGLVLSK